jgi:hypothetical protein
MIVTNVTSRTRPRIDAIQLRREPFRWRRKRTSPPNPRKIRASSSLGYAFEVRRFAGAGLVRNAVATSVLMVRVVVAALVPFGVTVAGAKEQVLAAGNAEQAKLTCWLKPNAGVTEMVVLPATPGVTVTVDGLMPTVKLGVPTVCVRGLDVDPAKFVSPE